MVFDPVTMGVAFGLGAIQGVATSISTNKRNKKFAKLLERNLHYTDAQISQSSAFNSSQISRASRSQIGQLRTSMADRGFESQDAEMAFSIQAFLEEIANITSIRNQKRAGVTETQSQINSLENQNPLLAAVTGGINGLALGASIFGPVSGLGGKKDGATRTG